MSAPVEKGKNVSEPLCVNNSTTVSMFHLFFFIFRYLIFVRTEKNKITPATVTAYEIREQRNEGGLTLSSKSV